MEEGDEMRILKEGDLVTGGDGVEWRGERGRC
jgi:hypothetical protein